MPACATISIGLAVVLHRQQLRRGGIVVVPEIVMHDLEVPQALSRARVEREQAVAEQIVALAIAAVEIVRRRAGRQKDDAVLLVEREIAPRVRAARVPEGILGPRLVSVFTGPRNRVERPHELAAEHVVRADVPRRRPVAFADVRSDDDEIFEDASGAVVRTAVAARGADAHVDEAFGAERQDLLAVARIHFADAVVRREDEAPVRAILALPVREPALGRAQRRHPQLLAGRRVERDEDAADARHVHHVVDDERVEDEPVGFAGHRIKPRAFELFDVALVDLRERGVLHRVRRPAVLIPLGVGRGCWACEARCARMAVAARAMPMSSTRLRAARLRRGRPRTARVDECIRSPGGVTLPVKVRKQNERRTKNE